MTQNNLQKKFGFITAIAMVIGIVIGSGVFFKAEKVLTATNGNLILGVFAWIVGGVIMIVCAYVFSILATRYEKVNGIVDYAEAAAGKTYGYYVGWFMSTIYYPSLTGILAWVSAKYTAVLFGFADVNTGSTTFMLTAVYLVAMYALNALSPILAGKFQVSTTVIKLVPLLALAIVGLISGLVNGQMIDNFTAEIVTVTTSNPLLTSIVATAFAYEGWIIATSINAELVDAKRNLPRALVGGTIVIVIIYIAYFIGLAGTMPTSELMEGGETAVRVAFTNTFGKLGGTLFLVFIVISCLGTTNGLMLGCTRGFYSLAVRNLGPKPDVFSRVDSTTNMPTNSAIIGLLLCEAYIFLWFGNFAGWWPIFLDVSELPIVTMYALYLPIFIWVIKNIRDASVFSRTIMPILAIIGSLFMMYAAFISHGIAVYVYLALFAIIMFIGFLVKGKRA